MAKTRRGKKCSNGVFGRVASVLGLPLRFGRRGVRGVANVTNSGLRATNSLLQGTANNLNSTASRLVSMKGVTRGKTRRGRKSRK
jgi:hypothetical protein